MYIQDTLPGPQDVHVSRVAVGAWHLLGLIELYIQDTLPGPQDVHISRVAVGAWHLLGLIELYIQDTLPGPQDVHVSRVAVGAWHLLGLIELYIQDTLPGPQDVHVSRVAVGAWHLLGHVSRVAVGAWHLLGLIELCLSPSLHALEALLSQGVFARYRQLQDISFLPGGKGRGGEGRGGEGRGGEGRGGEGRGGEGRGGEGRGGEGRGGEGRGGKGRGGGERCVIVGLPSLHSLLSIPVNGFHFSLLPFMSGLLSFPAGPTLLQDKIYSSNSAANNKATIPELQTTAGHWPFSVSIIIVSNLIDGQSITSTERKRSWFICN